MEIITKNLTLAILTFVFIAIMLAYVLCLTFVKNQKAKTIIKYVGMALALAFFIAILCVVPTKKADYEPLSSVAMYILTVVLVCGAVLLVFFFDDKPQTSFTKSLTYGGILIAISFGLSYVKLFSMPQGGSITLVSMFPIILYSYLFGAKKGLLAGIIYGILQLLQSPQIYQPVQVLLDYPIAFGVIGVAGISRSFKFLRGNSMLEFAFGATIGCVLRYVAHFLSGYFVFSSWAQEGYSALGWSLVYNLYIIVELALVLVVGCILFSSKTFSAEIKKRLV